VFSAFLVFIVFWTGCDLSFAILNKLRLKIDRAHSLSQLLSLSAVVVVLRWRVRWRAW